MKNVIFNNLSIDNLHILMIQKNVRPNGWLSHVFTSLNLAHFEKVWTPPDIEDVTND